MEKASYHVGFLTCCADDWGGSEELWAKSIPYLQDRNCKISVYKSKFNKSHPEIKQLWKGGALLKDLQPSLLLHERIGRKLRYIARRIVNRGYYQEPNYHLVNSFQRDLKITKPDLMIICQGINFDGLPYAYECLKQNIPYIIVCQKAVDFFWPQTHDKAFMKRSFQNARVCCFVSYHNLRLTEDQFGFRFKNSRIVFNPVKVRREILKYPPTDNGFRLACVARLFLIDKGQDILIKILTQDKWKNRPVTVSLIGSGADAINIQEMIDLYKLDNIAIEGFRGDMEDFWSDFHALVLPSRSEGLPLTIVEAMAAGRTVIVSDAGGNAEMVEEGITGFVGEATRRTFDDTMERAWEKRDQWDAMGRDAFAFVNANIPRLPEKDFADLIYSQLC